MWPDLGKYVVEVLSAYAGTILLLAGLIAMSVLRARRVRHELEKFEARRARKS